MDVQSGSGVATPGLYQDPTGRHQYRHWDGLAWTDIVSDNGQQSVDALSEASPLQTCENCQAFSSSGKRLVYYAGRAVSVRTMVMERKTDYEVLQRSSVFLCQLCAKSSSNWKNAIEREMASSGLGCTTYWLPGEFKVKFGRELLRNTSYVRIRDIGGIHLTGVN